MRLLLPVAISCSLTLARAAQVFLLQGPSGRGNDLFAGSSSDPGPSILWSDWPEPYNFTVRQCDDIGLACTSDRYRSWSSFLQRQPESGPDHVFLIPAKTNITLLVSGFPHPTDGSESIGYNYGWIPSPNPTLISYSWSLLHDIPAGQELTMSILNSANNLTIMEPKIFISKPPAEEAMIQHNNRMTLEGPDVLQVCSVAVFKIKGPGGPFELEIVDRTTEIVLEKFTEIPPGRFEWVVNIPAGTKIKYALTNNAGWVSVRSHGPTTSPGDNIDCLLPPGIVVGSGGIGESNRTYEAEPPRKRAEL